MSEPIERWNEDAPESFRVAKAAYAEFGPDAAQLERMLAHVEQTLPAPASRLGFGAKAWHWLLPVLTVIGVTLWIAGSRMERVAVAPAPARVERVAPASSPPAVALVSSPSSATEAATLPAGAGSVLASVGEAASPAVPTRRAQARPPDPLAELALLDRARRVLAKDPRRALALATEHQRHYATGQFAEERELLAIEALMRLDRADAAQRRARQFRRAHPNSVHAHRLGVILSVAAP